MKEEWRPVVGYENHYSVSNFGRVRRDLPEKNAVAGRIKSINIGSQSGRIGYATVGLCMNGRNKTVAVHRIVASAFLGPCPDGFDVNHKDVVKQNNAISNLEYASRSDNTKHAYAMGLCKTGNSHPASKLRLSQLEEIKNMAISGISKVRISKKFNVSAGTIGRFLNGKTWKYDFDADLCGHKKK